LNVEVSASQPPPHLVVGLAVWHCIAVLHLHHAIGDCAQQRADDALVLLLSPQEGVGDGEQHSRVHSADNLGMQM
jgi:hypothetical protein